MTNELLIEHWNTFAGSIRNNPESAKRAYESLVIEFTPKLLSRARSGFLKGGDTSLADDLVQETFIKLYERVRAAPDPTTVIERVQYNAVLNWLYNWMYWDWLKLRRKKMPSISPIEYEGHSSDPIQEDPNDRLEKKLDRKEFLKSELVKNIYNSSRFCFDLLVAVIVVRRPYAELIQIAPYQGQFKNIDSLKQKKYDCEQLFRKCFRGNYAQIK